MHSFAKCYKTHTVLKLPHLLIVCTKNQRPNKTLLEKKKKNLKFKKKKKSVLEYCCSTLLSAVLGRTGLRRSQGCSAAGFTPQMLPTERIMSKAERSCMWLIRKPAYFLLGWSKLLLIFMVLPQLKHHSSWRKLILYDMQCPGRKPVTTVSSLHCYQESMNLWIWQCLLKTNFLPLRKMSHA